MIPDNMRAFAEADIATFPLHPILPDGSCGCGKPKCKDVGKHPRNTNWQHTPVPDDDALEVMEASGQIDSGYGVLLSGADLLVVDVDPRNNGEPAFAKLVEQIPALAGAGLVVETGRRDGGKHFYFRLPADTSLVQSLKDYPGIDFKSSGYVVGPGSLHSAGHRYRILTGSPFDIEQAPVELVELLKRATPDTDTTRPANVDPDDLARLVGLIPNADADYDDVFIRVGMAIHESGGDFTQWDTWAAQSSKYDASVMAKKWRSFGKGETRCGFGTLLHLASKAGHDVSELRSKYHHQGEPPPTLDAGFDLSQFSMRGMAKEMREKMLDDKFIAGDLAILGQSTAIYAKPNAGKTLLMLWMLRGSITSGGIDGNDVFYINADDNHKGITTKLEFADTVGFHMLAPGYRGFKAQHLAEYLAALVQSETARGKVLILDTVKKFTDIMDKKKGSEFGESVRQLVSHGGSVLMLAHVNKHRDDQGKVIFSGTSDIVDDVDCAYTLDIVHQDAMSGQRTVRFENLKSRGDVASTASYTYDASDNMSYMDRLESVQSVSVQEEREAERRKQVEQIYLRNSDAVEAVRECLREGICKKTELVDEACERSGSTKKKLHQVLRQHTGTSLPDFQFWTVDVQDKNAHVYKLNFLA